MVAALAPVPVEAIEPEKPSDDPRLMYNQAHTSLIEGNYNKAVELYETAIEHSDDIEFERNALYNMAHAKNQLGEKELKEQEDLNTSMVQFMKETGR